jgi:hypothetical protein
MSCLASSYIACATLQADLTQYYDTCGASMIREPMPFAEFLASPLNNKGLSQAIAPGRGKVRTVELTYTARIPESQVVENDTDLCSCTDTRGNCSQLYTLDPDANLSICEKIDHKDLRHVCKPNDQFIMEKVAYLVDALERKVATKLVQQASFLAGEWNISEVPNVVNGQLVVKTKKDSDAFSVNPFAMSEIDFALTATGYCQPAAIFGGRELFQYYRNMLAGCCADSGVDLNQMMSLYGKAVAYDPRIANAANGFVGGQNVGVAIAPGSLALLTWNEFGWNAGTPLPFNEGSNYARSLMVSPRLGIPMDVIVKDECPGTLTIVISTVVKLAEIPNDIFPVGDIYRGVNFFNEIRVVNV